MKKFVVLLITVLAFSGVYAQPNNVVASFNYLNRGKLDKAKEAIDKAVEHQKTMTDAKTWFYYGNVYLSIQLTDEEEYKDLDPNPLDKAYEAYVKSIELDTKNEYVDQVRDRILVCSEQYFNNAVSDYNEKDYKKAAEAFAKSAMTRQEMGSIDTLSIFYAGQSAFLGEDYQNARKHMIQAKDLNYPEPAIYSILASVHKVEGDTAAAIMVINEGREVFPDDYALIIDAANLYLATGLSQEALDVLTLAIEKDKSNPSLFFAAGTIYDKMGNFEKARDLYQDAINVDADYFDANYNLGALYFNKAVEIITEAGNLPLNETAKYDKMMEEGKAMMQKALPYLEKADSIQESDQITLQTLKEIYTRLGMMDKVKGVNERLNN
ncbi:MAG TPA: tetratricopeptide repeat protein [Bacteroidales bacterium]|nr:tetratricopeptide repeat protein [Bacteroidales bacterium]